MSGDQKDDAIKKLWLNGAYVDVDMSLLYQFIHDLPADVSEEQKTEWLQLFSFGEMGGSAWTHYFQRSLLQMKSCILEVGPEFVESLASEKNADLGSALMDVLGLLEQLEILITRSEKTVVTCWAEDPSRIVETWQKLTPDVLSDIRALPHFNMELFFAEADIRDLKKDCNRHLAEFNKWRKHAFRRQ